MHPSERRTFHPGKHYAALTTHYYDKTYTGRLLPISPMSSDMPPRNLLVCFDAFGTLFTPKRPIAQQYGEVARSYGMSGFGDEDVAKSFKQGACYSNGLTDGL